MKSYLKGFLPLALAAFGTYCLYGILKDPDHWWGAGLMTIALIVTIISRRETEKRIAARIAALDQKVSEVEWRTRPPGGGSGRPRSIAG